MTNSSYDVPSGPAAPLSNPVTAVKTVRVVAALTFVLGMIGSLVLVTTVDASLGDRIYVGQGIGLLAMTIALSTLLLFVAGWAEHTLARDGDHVRDETRV